jgi:hypothetical protein
VLWGRADGTFAPDVTFDTTGDVYSLAAADFNGDSRLDLAVANLDRNAGIAILTNTGGRDFGRLAVYPTAPGTGDAGADVFAVGDFNGDGAPDIIAGQSNNSGLALVINQRDGTFAPAVSMQGLTFNDCLIAGDFNGDGLTDFATSERRTFSTSVFVNQGQATFAPEASFQFAGESGGFWEMTSGAFTGTSPVDLAYTTGTTGHVVLAVGVGSGMFMAPTVLKMPYPTAMITGADFNSDGLLDLAVGVGSVGDGDGGYASYDRVGIVLNAGGGQWQPPVTYATDLDPVDMTAADFNGDGRADIAFVGGPGRVSVLLSQCR